MPVALVPVQAVHLHDGQKFVDSGTKGVYHSWSSGNIDTLVAAIKTGAFSSTTTRWTSGILENGASSGTDQHTGGASYFFTRPWGETPPSGGLSLVFGPETLERTDWHGSTSDHYGCTNPNHGMGSGFTNRPGRYGVGSMYEVCFQSAIGLSELRAISCDAGKKTSIVAKLKATGIHEINGIPVEDFVQETAYYSNGAGIKKAVMDHWDATKAKRKAGS